MALLRFGCHLDETCRVSFPSNHAVQLTEAESGPGLMHESVRNMLSVSHYTITRYPVNSRNPKETAGTRILFWIDARLAYSRKIERVPLVERLEFVDRVSARRDKTEGHP